ncbi:Uncharacterised protein [Achromobacter spanius]|uniref:DUF4435 domain-containing protein n=1 Tax=Achromobacter spanius TaxID=217203 RepID=UPI000D8EAA13|nr:DUF4435 domain-containing protein [Achromobacter spanius]CAB3682423.1 hypothetical protein LMG5911_04054 [Achromobacter spanius]SPT38495.1 Uncharacterised protein [Achromobacter denitrificans]VEE59618.1 Uncharacterised protein [Achromobacter spanius]
MTGMFYEVDEILNESIMTGVPSVIVEGIDDINIYIDLATHLPFNLEVYAVEHIEGFGQGCDQVINAINALEALPETALGVHAHVLGIVDKDVRDFRGEIPASSSLLVLKYYSIESHFISKSVIENLLRLCTKASRPMITDEIVAQIMSEIDLKLLDLYYHSLEALRNAIQKNYPAAFAYSYTPGRLKDPIAKEMINSKKHELDQFANSLNLGRTIDAVKSIARGKWLIDVFSEELVGCIKRLQGLCKEERIRSCSSCVTTAYEKCLYRIKEGIQPNTVRSLALTHAIGEEFDYIIERMSQLQPSPPC